MNKFTYLKALGFLLFFALLSTTSKAHQGDSACYTFTECQYRDSLRVYEAAFGQNKEMPDSLRLAFLTALSHYPELWHCNIRVTSRSISTTMQAQPVVLSLLGKKKNREYVIILNNRQGNEKGLSYSKINFETLVGWFAHEFAHVLSYEERSTMGMVGFGFNYLFSGKKRMSIEREADLIACERGFAHGIYQGKVLLTEDKDISRSYKQRVKRYYLTPAEIRSFFVRMH